MNTHYIHPDELVIERKETCVGAAVFVGEAGEDSRLQLPGCLTDNEAKSIVLMINRLYDQAYEMGKHARSREIAGLLGVKWECPL